MAPILEALELGDGAGELILDDAFVAQELVGCFAAGKGEAGLEMLDLERFALLGCLEGFIQGSDLLVDADEQIVPGSLRVSR